MHQKKDFLDEIIEERTSKNPRFAEMLAEANARRELVNAGKRSSTVRASSKR